MYPFWDLAVAPVLEAIQAERIVEIGALRGENTVLLLDRLGPGSELHVIDPVPAFDPAEHEQRFPGRYVFHRDLSLNVLPNLPAVDAALIDGDHNWYTVYHELRHISDTARAAGKPLPVMILHDVLWPYGRRDLYYAPEQVPAEYRQPHAQRGMSPARKELLPEGGLNPTMHNALVSGGSRNGVMTALDDFMAEYDRPLRRIVLPIYFGLAIVAEEERFRQQPEFARICEWLESDEGRGKLLELSEKLRIKAMMFQHGVVFKYEQRLERLASRHLDLLKAALLDEHYLENELRVAHLSWALEKGRPVDTAKLRDPVRRMKDEYRRLLTKRRAGTGSNGAGPSLSLAFTTMGRTRLDQLQACLDTLRRESIEGDFVECGTGRGGGAIFLRGYVDAHELKTPTVWVADRFHAGTEGGSLLRRLRGAQPSTEVGPLLPDLNTVRDAFDRFDLLDERVRFLQGPLADTLPAAPIESIALLRLGDRIGAAAGDALDALYDRVAVGGFVVVDDPDTDGCREAVDAFRARRGVADPIERVDATGFRWRKGSQGHVTEVEPAAARDHAPLATPAPVDAKDLSVVVVFYNMRREAERTLHSLSRAYQQGVDDLDYEVIVVENGSDPDQRLGADLVRSFGPEFRYLDLGDAATPTPVGALNRGIAASTGSALALMIDGAHVLTPGVLRYGMAGLATYAPAVVATQQWYVGPGQQPEMMQQGYDQDYEDRLFAEIEWPADGYRLFDVGHFIGERDWLDGMWESNCMFVPRALLEQVGCFDESFSMPGGGYANLELYERLGAAPGVTVATILGEGSFHQVHGGTTTNLPDETERNRRLGSYAGHYEELRGRGFVGHQKQFHYVGGLPAGARRTRARRRISTHFKAAASDPDGFPTQPTPMPEELRREFTDAYWRTLAWQDTTWLGRRVAKAPTDLVAYQELLAAVRPDWIVETGTGDGGRAVFLASICDLLDHGRVVSIDPDGSGERPEHPRITYVTGAPVAEGTLAEVRALVGESPSALVVLGSRGSRPQTMQEFEAYSPFVPVGSYVVIEDTVVNGHPVWPSFGPGPAEAANSIVTARGDFVVDSAIDKYGLTFNPGGFLKRIS